MGTVQEIIFFAFGILAHYILFFRLCDNLIRDWLRNLWDWAQTERLDTLFKHCKFRMATAEPSNRHRALLSPSLCAPAQVTPPRRRPRLRVIGTSHHTCTGLRGRDQDSGVSLVVLWQFMTWKPWKFIIQHNKSSPVSGSNPASLHPKAMSKIVVMS